MRVTLDLFSGRPNPTWTLSGRQARELRGRMAGSPPLVQAARTGPTAEPSRLGFRGFVVHEDEPGELLPSPVPRAAPAAARVAAPDLLAIRAEGAEEAATAVSDEVDTAEWLIATAPEAVVGGMVDELAGELRDLRSASGAAVRTARTTREAPEDGSEAGARGRDRDLDDVTGGEACRPYLLPMNLAFWNTPGIQPYNNCYNYATNFVGQVSCEW